MQRNLPTVHDREVENIPVPVGAARVYVGVIEYGDFGRNVDFVGGWIESLGAIRLWS